MDPLDCIADGNAEVISDWNWEHLAIAKLKFTSDLEENLAVCKLTKEVKCLLSRVFLK